jgi:hypothetical protein
MAHFAELDENNIVQQVIVVANEELLDNGVESEAKGIAFCQSLFGGNWVQTSYNKTFRKNYCGSGFSYDLVRDAFIPPKPFNSWLLNEDTCLWEAPTPYPTDGKFYNWVEADLNWQLDPNLN